jgi:hypothetical protein
VSRLSAAAKVAAAALMWLVVGCHSTTERADALHNRGAITVDSRRYLSGGQTYGQGSATAAFVRDQTDPFLGCERRVIGPCDAHFNCKPVRVDPLPDMAQSGDLGVSLYASAGTISVEGLPMAVSLTLMTSGMFAGQYNVFQQYTPMFSGGETLTVRAGGGEVPAFMNLVTAPPEPTVSAQLPSPLSRNQDLPLGWSGGGAGQLRVSVSVQQAMTSAGLECSFSSSAGAGAIPAQALQMLPAGQAVFGFTVVSANDFFAGAWQVELAATTGVLLPAGTPYDQAYVILQ